MCKKSNVLPIHCSEEDMGLIHSMLPCEISDFLCKYLGLPLSIRKLTKEQLQPIIDRIADQLSGWKAELMTRAWKGGPGSACLNSHVGLSGHVYRFTNMGYQGY
jgi:hypothetical protein